MAQGPEFFGFTGNEAETAKAVAGAAVGAAIAVYHKYPGSIVRALILYALSFLLGIMLVGTIGKWTGLSPDIAGVLSALLGMAATKGLLAAVEQFDWSNWLPKRKGQADS
jgi:hypothetical protein